VLSALKQAEDRSSTIVRLFNPGQQDADVVLSADRSIGQAFVVNFLEERQSALRIVDSAVELRLKPKQIQTIELVSQIQV
jgi:alpha-mannosidase